MKSLKYTLLAGALLTVSCQSDNETPHKTASVKPADFTLRATSDIQTPSPIKAATFVPNSVASWLGHIILLDDKGTLHRATTDSAETEVVALGRYADVIGLAREKKSGVFLALTPQGQIKAFVQSDNEGNFSPLALSQGEYTFKRFCASSAPTSDRIWAETSSGDARVFAADIFEDTSLSFNETDAESDEVNLCDADATLELGAGYILNPDNGSEHLTLSANDKDIAVAITNGLSIGGIKTSGFVTTTSANMGSVFNEGVLLVADEAESRLVLISRGYAIKELKAR